MTLARMAAIMSVLAAITIPLSAASGAPSVSAAACEVGVLLPAGKPGSHWATQRSELERSLKSRGLTSCIWAAPNRKMQIRHAAIALRRGVKVIVLAPVSSASANVIGPASSARQTPVIAYGKLARYGFASYLVSFDDFKIGQMQAKALASCLRTAKTYSRHPVITQITGPDDDINARLVSRGFRDVADPLFEKGTYVRGPIASAPMWSSAAGRNAFLRTLAKSGRRVDGVFATNDQFAGEVIGVLNARRQKAIPVTGQDATFASMQNIVDGEQCVTFLKPVRWQAEEAGKLAASLVRKKDPTGLNGKVFDGDQDVPSVLVPAVPITKRNFFLMFNEGIYRRGDVCDTPARVGLCFQ